MEQLAWQEQANCKGLDVDMFYYTEEYLSRKERRRKEKIALRVCGNCNVKKECLQDAIDRDDVHSIQGGTTPRDRGHRVYVPELDFPTSVVTIVPKDFETKKGAQNEKTQADKTTTAIDVGTRTGTTVS